MNTEKQIMDAQNRDITASRVIGRPFEKGNRANPGGRPKYPAWFKDHIEIAQDKVLYWLNSKNPKVSLEAAKLVLAYALGRPTDRHEVSGADGSPISQIIVKWEDASTGE